MCFCRQCDKNDYFNNFMTIYHIQVNASEFIMFAVAYRVLVSQLVLIHQKITSKFLLLLISMKKERLIMLRPS